MNYISEEELYKTDLTHSTIEQCYITTPNEIISMEKRYQPLLTAIWKTMPSQQILQTTTFNFKLTNENGEKGYSYFKWFYCF